MDLPGSVRHPGTSMRRSLLTVLAITAALALASTEARADDNPHVRRWLDLGLVHIASPDSGDFSGWGGVGDFDLSVILPESSMMARLHAGLGFAQASGLLLDLQIGGGLAKVGDGAYGALLAGFGLRGVGILADADPTARVKEGLGLDFFLEGRFGVGSRAFLIEAYGAWVPVLAQNDELRAGLRAAVGHVSLSASYSHYSDGAAQVNVLFGYAGSFSFGGGGHGGGSGVIVDTTPVKPPAPAPDSTAALAALLTTLGGQPNDVALITPLLAGLSNAEGCAPRATPRLHARCSKRAPIDSASACRGAAILIAVRAYAGADGLPIAVHLDCGSGWAEADIDLEDGRVRARSGQGEQEGYRDSAPMADYITVKTRKTIEPGGDQALAMLLAALGVAPAVAQGVVPQASALVSRDGCDFTLDPRYHAACSKRAVIAGEPECRAAAVLIAAALYNGNEGVPVAVRLDCTATWAEADVDIEDGRFRARSGAGKAEAYSGSEPLAGYVKAYERKGLELGGNQALAMLAGALGAQPEDLGEVAPQLAALATADGCSPVETPRYHARCAKKAPFKKETTCRAAATLVAAALYRGGEGLPVAVRLECPSGWAEADVDLEDGTIRARSGRGAKQSYGGSAPMATYITVYERKGKPKPKPGSDEAIAELFGQLGAQPGDLAPLKSAYDAFVPQDSCSRAESPVPHAECKKQVALASAGACRGAAVLMAIKIYEETEGFPARVHLDCKGLWAEGELGIDEESIGVRGGTGDQQTFAVSAPIRDSVEWHERKDMRPVVAQPEPTPPEPTEPTVTWDRSDPMQALMDDFGVTPEDAKTIDVWFDGMKPDCTNTGRGGNCQVQTNMSGAGACRGAALAIAVKGYSEVRPWGFSVTVDCDQVTIAVYVNDPYAGHIKLESRRGDGYGNSAPIPDFMRSTDAEREERDPAGMAPSED